MKLYTVGLGCDRGAALETVREAVHAALAEAGATPGQVLAAATIVIKQDEAALLAIARELDWPLRFYAAHELAAVPVPHPSETVLRHTGTPSVSEAAALLAAGPGTPMSALVVEKYKYRGADGRHATVSIARKEP
ncbi:cobalamin biosynthesis protein [Massilia sp. METH4]|uniref:cobalamin biosynthesis protein n=1 Tax=Massilia sp. METH4 TaxID=3123041 RepID=UPI0030D23368